MTAKLASVVMSVLSSLNPRSILSSSMCVPLPATGTPVIHSWASVLKRIGPSEKSALAVE